MNETTALLIIGAGPAGMAAALAAASSGMRIVLLDDNPWPGGQIWRDGPQAHLPAEARRLRNSLQACANVRCHAGTRVIACAADKTLLVEDAERGWQITYQRLILCTGARELLLPFPSWTLPGVTAVGGLQALIKSGLPVRGERLVIAGSCTKAASTVFGGVFSFILIIVFSFYFAVLETGVDDFLRIVTPRKYEAYVLDLWRRSRHKIGLWMQGQLLLALVFNLFFLGPILFPQLPPNL